MLALGELLVQAPEHLHDGERGCSDRVGEVTSGGRHGPDDGHGALAVGGAQALHAARTLVESCKNGKRNATLVK